MIAIIQYVAGNTGSVQNALNRLGLQSIITDDAATIKNAEKVILPGVGEASTAMQSLATTGLDKLIPTLRQPVLGICLGMQLLCNRSEEGDTTCLGVFDADVIKFPTGHIVPHMGWNNITDIKGELLLGANDADVYFVHSYYVPVCADTIATCNYILPFSAAIQKNNFYATQFHPEKSGGIGEQILNNFLAI
ncbi:MAG: imidazole glycerol phosphate synthase subunit HisH [Flavipsychrobacter sp.]